MSKEEIIVEHLVNVNRVTKVVKGGRRFSFSACIVLGNKAGSVGYGHGKANEVSEARFKASQTAKKYMIQVPLCQGRTIYYDVYGKSGAAKVMLRRAKAGTGIIAGGAMRFIFDSLGIQDVVAKSFGSSNPYSMIAATLNALKQLTVPRAIAERRGLKLSELSVTVRKKKIINNNDGI
ncbi:ribosomal protein S5 [Orientia chuto str. Dubai]|uniref:Small ribosomal subunit protein uS5 n=1 Tax=Orientia chuto str. Dubai TaxID=1359168 RepID=A0A0F3MII0_9RICK|nr:30S ribosomal protein S5 [Candidatus Orientia mediorientalis]KJV55277.1 ribosomal protein S5 [Orientia chuto str. Dubai]